MASGSGRASAFLYYIDTRYWYLPDDCEPVLDLLKLKLYGRAFELVSSGQVRVKVEMASVGQCLLHLAMHRSPCSDRPPNVEDVRALLTVAKEQGEVVDESDLLVACHSASSALVKLILEHGVPVSPNSLHVLFGKGMFAEDEVLKAAAILLEARAQVDGLGSSRRTPLAVVCESVGNRNRKEQCMRWLLGHGADPSGATGLSKPVHALVGSIFCSDTRLVQLLLDSRADINERCPVTGGTPLHRALDPRTNFKMALQLKELGADVSLLDANGRRASQLLLAAGMPEQAAQIEDRAMSAEELEMRQAMNHPVAAAFERSGLSGLSWVLRSSPESLRQLNDDSEWVDAGSFPEQTIASLLGGVSPKTIAVRLPLTRYSEICEDVAFDSPPEGFTVLSLLMELYKYYQECFSAAQLERIRSLNSTGSLVDVFGYIAQNVPEDAQTDMDSPAKRQAVPRINLRGDSVFFEGFGECRYHQREDLLFGCLQLGS